MDFAGEQPMLSLEELRACTKDGRLAVSRVLDVLETLRSASQEVRAGAADALQGIDRLAAAHWAPIGPLCLDSNVAVAYWACKMAAKVGSAHRDAEKVLLRALIDHPHLQVRQQAALGLCAMSRLDATTIATLQHLHRQETDSRLIRCIDRALESTHRTEPSNGPTGARIDVEQRARSG